MKNYRVRVRHLLWEALEVQENGYKYVLVDLA
jgi:hypothetical protein